MRLRNHSRLNSRYDFRIDAYVWIDCRLRFLSIAIFDFCNSFPEIELVASWNLFSFSIIASWNQSNTQSISTRIFSLIDFHSQSNTQSKAVEINFEMELVRCSGMDFEWIVWTCFLFCINFEWIVWSCWNWMFEPASIDEVNSYLFCINLYQFLY